ncbi:hypothetical protein AN478_08250 [Thiohalorhabdus denitrificans]|uniref:hypothetical protein n=1 Tax=Thiohalorhabdus denitrificans TaxID=381306 RepID=UPI0006D5B2E6|nr:hypothetical protein [Thiohalorhabdus denitrificans]KPV40126.1 hypothetical protein AN478_08250 [Thiohalorhabdus denitrificans]
MADEDSATQTPGNDSENQSEGGSGGATETDGGEAVPETGIAPFEPHWGKVGVFTEATTCQRCHRASPEGATPAVMRYPDADGADVSPAGGWGGSMMDQAFHDPYYQAVVAEEAERFPHYAGDIEDKCLTCHAPMARTHAHQTGTGLSGENCQLNPDGCFRMETAWGQEHAREGVSCTVCHQIQDDGSLGTKEGYSGKYSISADPSTPEIFGPFENPRGTGMANISGYTPVHAPHMDRSETCATCHNLYTPTFDLEGNPTGDEFLEQGPHLEWKNSRFAGERSCQDCHMPQPEDGYATRIAVRQSGEPQPALPERTPFHRHALLGGNAYMLDVMEEFREELGLRPGVEEQLEEKAEQTRAFLGNQAAELRIPRLERSGAELLADVEIHNLTGHKLPTSFPSRRMWLHLTVTDAEGEVVFESGAVDEKGRLLMGSDPLRENCLAVEKPEGFTNAGCYEPHRNEIRSEEEVAVYEAVLGDVNGHVTHVLLHADTYLKDNRIPPEGFTESGAGFVPDTAVAGAAREDGDFNRNADGPGSGRDTVHYRIPLAEAQGSLTVRAELRYQTIRPSFVEGLHAEDEKVGRFKAMYGAMPPAVEQLAVMERSLP